MRLVIIESPFAGDVARNLRYLRAAMFDCLTRGEAPFASHGLYTQPGVLDDGNSVERDIGIHAGFEWRAAAEATIVYTDLGITKGMDYGIKAADQAASYNSPGYRPHVVEFRTLGAGWELRACEREAMVTTRWP